MGSVAVGVERLRSSDTPDGASHSFDGDLNLLEGGGEATAEEPFTTGAKGAAGDARDAFFLEQAEGEFLRG